MAALASSSPAPTISLSSSRALIKVKVNLVLQTLEPLRLNSGSSSVLRSEVVRSF